MADFYQNVVPTFARRRIEVALDGLLPELVNAFEHVRRRHALRSAMKTPGAQTGISFVRF